MWHRLSIVNKVNRSTIVNKFNKVFAPINDIKYRQYFNIRENINNNMKIRLISDIHLEYRRKYWVSNNDKDCQILILAGDIGYPYHDEYKNFLIHCKREYHTVILVPGNHEYYNTSIEEANQKLQELQKETGIILLDKKIHKINNITFMGCTLWSKLSIKDENLPITNDMYKICKNKKHINRQVYNNLHQEDVNFLQSNIPLHNDIVVITHHLPSYNLIHQDYIGNPCNEFFASDLDYLVKNKNVKLWLFGHSHMRTIWNKCQSNPLGYPNEQSYFNPDLIIDV